MARKTAREHFPSLTFTAILLGTLLLGGAAFLYSGIYNIAADDPHTPLVHSILDDVRDRSIETHASNIQAPADLLSADRIARGAVLYQEMCVSCHLGPGVKPSELSQGLYPQAPKLAVQTAHSAGELFWIIKHGVKLTAMPAWGKTHPDPLIWDMVAFVSKLPKMSPAEFQKTVASAPAGHDEMMEMGSGHHVGQAAGEGSQLQAPNTAAGHRDQDGSAPHGH